MNTLTLGEIFYKLERTLRFADSGAWLPLEPINPELLSKLEEIIRPEIADGPPKIDARSAQRPAAEKTRADIKSISDPSPPFLAPPAEKADPDHSEQETDKLLNLRPEEAKSLHSLRLRLRDCPRCPLCLERKTMVFGQGNTSADIMFVGEGPGSEEDKSGLAFVGRAGRLLTQIIQSIGLNREDVYICNAIKCRPPGNRVPNIKEISKCSPFLFKQIDLLKPKLIVILGAVALKTLLPQSPGITEARGKLCYYKDIPALPTFHPAYLLRNKSALPLVWNDMRQVRQILYRLSAGKTI